MAYFFGSWYRFRIFSNRLLQLSLEKTSAYEQIYCYKLSSNLVNRFTFWLKKILLYGSVSLVSLAVLLTLLIQFYQDEIIAKVLAEVNKSLKTRIDIGKIEVSLWKKFPHLSVHCQTIKAAGSLPEHKLPLARANDLYLLFNISDLLSDNLAIDQIVLENADVQLYVDDEGNPNYDIIKNSISEKDKTSPRDVQFDLRRIRLSNVKVRYTDVLQEQDHQLLAEQADARLFVKNDDYLIHLKGALQSKYIRIGKETYFANKHLKISSEMQYDYDLRKLLIQPSQVWVNQSEFEVMGYHAAKPYSFIDLQCLGKHTDLQTLVSLLPESFYKTYASYQSKGNVYFKGSVIGYIEDRRIPKVDVQFGCKDASFYETRLKKRIEHANLTGSYSNGNQQNEASSSLVLKKVSGLLDGRPFSGNLSLRNFANPHLAFDLKGTLDVAAVTAFFPYGIKDGAGLLTANVQFEGNLNDLRNKALNRFVRTSGEIKLREVGFTLVQRPLRLHRLTGDFAFNKSDLLVKSLTGNAGKSDFRLSGRFENVLSYLLLDDQALRVVADFQSQHLNFDELLAENPGVSSGKKEQYRLRLSRRLDLDLNCRINSLQFRRFRAQNIRGDLDMHDGIARSRDISLSTAGGNMNLNVGIDARQTNLIQVSTYAQLAEIQIDSVFYMFEDFGQDFIRAQHLRGKMTSRIQTYLVFDEHLQPNNDKLVAEVSATVRNGQLLGFEPMQKLSSFIRESELANLRFGEMQNNIHIEKRNVYIPLMEISSNVANISVQGTHSFDNVMDYHLRIPLKTFFQKKNTLQASVQNPANQTNLFLQIKGTADRYKISYDTKAVRDKIRQDLQARKSVSSMPSNTQAFRPAFKSEKVTPVTPKPAEEAYFDFQ